MCLKSLETLEKRLNRPDLGLLFIRIALGAVFLNAGYMKVANMEMTLAGFSSMGFSPFLTYLATYGELIGGALALVGLFTRFAGLTLAIIMAVATEVLFKNGFSLANGGYEYPFSLLCSALALITLGGGKYSLSALLCKGKK